MNQFKKGDKVRCIHRFYVSYEYLEVAEVLDVYGGLIKLRNSFNDHGFSWYSSQNWELIPEPRKTTMPAFAKTKYFAVRINPEDGSFFNLDNEHQTVNRDTKSEVITDIKVNISENEVWLVLQAVAMVKGEAPRPPVTITEFK